MAKRAAAKKGRSPTLKTIASDLYVGKTIADPDGIRTVPSLFSRVYQVEERTAVMRVRLDAIERAAFEAIAKDASLFERFLVGPLVARIRATTKKKKGA